MVDIFVVGYAWFREMDYGKDKKWSLTNMSTTPKTPLTLTLSRTRERVRRCGDCTVMLYSGTGTCAT